MTFLVDDRDVRELTEINDDAAVVGAESAVVVATAAYRQRKPRPRSELNRGLNVGDSPGSQDVRRAAGREDGSARRRIVGRSRFDDVTAKDLAHGFELRAHGVP